MEKARRIQRRESIEIKERDAHAHTQKTRRVTHDNRMRQRGKRELRVKGRDRDGENERRQDRNEKAREEGARSPFNANSGGNAEEQAK